MKRIDLGGRWNLSQRGKNEKIKATVPGCVHTDLLAAKKIEDPFYRDNELSLQWIGETAWVYSRTFTVSKSVIGHDRVALRCHGLDTLATVRINGRPVGVADNMFRTWEFDVRRVLKEGKNTIEVTLGSVIPYIARRQRERQLHAWKAPNEVKGGCWVRKMPCNFGWDWGPVLVTAGIWRDIELVAFDAVRLADVSIRQDHGKRGEVGLAIAASVEGDGELTARATVSLDGSVVATGEAPIDVGTGTVDVTVGDAQLWWPNGMGGQPLYDVAIEVVDASGHVVDEAARCIGLRTLALDRKTDKWGESFQFVANGVPFFAKGANWIPADAFPTRVSDEQYARLLGDSAAAHMNMVRVWGGGVYECDRFYDLCDELGLCVWQDFMFACSTYPAFDADFLASVRAEAEDNVRRIRHHPCLALWCGNNELEQGLVDDAGGEWKMNWADYGALFDELLPEVVARLDPERDYWPSSAHSPHGDRCDAQNPAWGDAHLWAVWHGQKPFEWYRTAPHRFVSEFGFQSFPEPRTVEAYTEPEDRNVTSYVMEQHQRSGTGNTRILQYLLDWFRLPTEFDATLWLTQILHGMAMKYAVEHWRRNMPQTMGAIYWQLNDCWPVASWASIDYHGRWKALHYLARRFYAPLLVSGVEDPEKGAVAIHVTSDLPTRCPATVRWSVTDAAGKPLAQGSKDVTVAARKDCRVETLKLAKLLKQVGERNLLVWVDLEVEGSVVSQNLVTFARPKHLELQAPEFEVAIEAAADGGFAVELTAKHPALWAWLELDGTDAAYSDNFVDVRPGRSVDILVYPAEPMTAKAFAKALKVRSLTDTYA
ncbi:glycoside hydrolase family 2 protein [bacterium]|nr:glycoside hydrolase family 2 protein [bacterium]